MSDVPSPITWNSLIDDLATAKYGKIHDDDRPDLTEYASEASTQASTHSDTSQRHAERVVRTLDYQRCFVTNKSGSNEVARILDNCGAGNGQLVDALRGLGIVHHNFNPGDVSNLLLMSRRLHVLWNKYAAFVIVPSKETRRQMIEIVIRDRRRIMLAWKNNEVVKPHHLAYPESVTYDIILVRPSLFGNERQYFQRADSHDDDPTYYRIPAPSGDLSGRLEYLTKQDDETYVSQFLNISHVTGRSSQEVINPYLMVMNALPKLKHWNGWASEILRGFVKPFPTRCSQRHSKTVNKSWHFMTTRVYGAIHMSRCICDGQAQGYKEDGSGDEGGEKNSSVSSRDPEEEPESPPGSSGLHHDPSTQPGTRSWISRGNFNKMNSLEQWRQDVSEFSGVGTSGGCRGNEQDRTSDSLNLELC